MKINELNRTQFDELRWRLFFDDPDYAAIEEVTDDDVIREYGIFDFILVPFSDMVEPLSIPEFIFA